jgi:hypothetical protein
MHGVGFEATITVFEQAKTFHALEHSAGPIWDSQIRISSASPRS